MPRLSRSPLLALGLTAATLALGAVRSAIAPHAGVGTRHTTSAATAGRLAPGDTVVTWGPRQFNGSSGQGQTYVESFTATVASGKLYTLHLVNGNASGGQRASKVVIKLNGFEIVSQNEVTQAVAVLDRPVALTPTDTIRVTVAGSGSPFVTLSILGIPDGTYNLFGPNQYIIPTGSTTKTFGQAFTKPAAAAAPYRIYVVNGSATGTQRVTSGSVGLNGTTIISTSELTSGVGSITKVVTLAASNTVAVTVNGPAASFITLRVTATDTAVPGLTITSPAPGALTNQSSIAVSGTISDQTPTTVAVNGTAATVTNNTSYTATVPLTAQGNNLLTVVATDANGRHRDSTRTVVRDTQNPTLSVTAPADGFSTPNASVTVTATASDANGVTVNTNGTPLTLSGGSYSGSVALTPGSNVLLTTATDGAGNTTTDTRTVTRDVSVALTVSAPTEGATTSADSITVSGTVSPTTGVTVTAAGFLLPVTAGAFSGKVPLDPGLNTISVLATNGVSNTTVVRHVTRSLPSGLPPDPVTVAPALDRTAATPLASATSFLYTGANPIQTGVTANAINPARAAVLRGRVLSRSGNALPGATVSVLNHPEWGQTLSRADGNYDLAVNGGGLLTLKYEMSGYIGGQRQVDAPLQDYRYVEDVALVHLDGQVTNIDLSGPAQVARGTPVTDSDGTRQATLIFKPGTLATMVFPNGSTQPLSSLAVRATEFTVGNTGLAAMPGQLPATSAYTYAAELSVDQAVAAGATSVQFSQPVPYYLENFLGFAVGTAVPAGYYDRQQGKWIATPDGRVIKIVGVTAGSADLDINGDGTADTPSALAAIGIDSTERQKVATLYTVGQGLWRVPVTHFTPEDFNRAALPDSAKPSDVAGLPKNNVDRSCHTHASIIECENQVLGEELGVTGTPYRLTYSSARAPGRLVARKIPIRLSKASVPTSLKRIDLAIAVAGERFDSSFTAGANKSYVFTWDGLDGYGRPVQGTQVATIRIGYVYDAVYLQPSQVAQSFAQFSGIPITGNPTRREFTLWQEQRTVLGAWDASGIGLGGWSLSAHHAYDPIGKVLYLGTGEQRSAQNQNAVIRRFAGTGIFGPGTYSYGDGGQALAGGFDTPEGVAVGPDGSLYVVDNGGQKVRRINPAGIMSTVAGTGAAQTSPDGIPATQASLQVPDAVVVGPDGTVYIGESGAAKVRRVDPDGIIRRVAGTGTSGFSGDGGPATAAQIGADVRGLAYGPDGSLYIADGANARIRKVSPDGMITTVAGNGTYDYGADGIPATQSPLAAPIGVAIGPDGSLYIAESKNVFSTFIGARVRRVTPSGIISTVAGNGVFPGALNTNGVPATQTRFAGFARSIAVGPDGSIYVGDQEDGLIRWVGPDGIVNTLAGDGPATGITLNFEGEGGPAAQSQIGGARGLAVGPDGSIYIGDFYNRIVQRIAPAFKGFSNTDLAIPSEDGSELYQFDGAGRHLRTRNALTGAVLLTFGYDAAGRLSTITDADANVTTVERDGQGKPTAIVAPFGQRTPLAVDGAGLLASVTDPGGNVVRLWHRSTGLLDSLADPRGKIHKFAYNALGQLTRDDDPASGFKTLARTENDTSWSVSISTAMSRTRQYQVAQLATGAERRVQTDPAGFKTTSVRGMDETTTTLRPDGSTVTSIQGPDPRWGMQAGILRSWSLQTPGGLTATITGRRGATLSNAGDLLSLTTQTDSLTVNGQLFRTAYSAATRRFTETSPEGRQHFTSIDSVGRVKVERTLGLDSTLYAYDSRGRLSQVQTGGRVWSYSYDAKSRLLSTLDPIGRQDSLFYDTADRVTRQVLPGGRAILFAYDSSGNVTTITPPGRPQHGFGYSAVDQTSGYTPPSAGLSSFASTFSYNADHQLTGITRPDNLPLTFGYDGSGRPSTVTFDRGTLTFGYNATTGTLSSIAAPGSNTLSYTYDGSLLKTMTWGGTVLGSVGVGYNSDFRVTSQTVNGGSSLSFGYDRDGLLTTAGALGVKRHAQHGLVERDSLNTIKSVRSYTTRGALAGSTSSSGSGTLFQTGYIRDSLDRITSITEGVGSDPSSTTAFTYDSAGRLFEVRRDGVLTATYEYDLNGNRTRLTTPSGVLTGTVDDQDRLIQYGTTSYTYGSNGELKTKTEPGIGITSYTYDALGNLVAATLPDGTALSYVIDGQNRRVGKKVNGSLVQGLLYQSQLAPVAELDGSNQVVSRFVYGTRATVPDYMVKGGTTYRLISDHLGSVRLVVNAADGTIAQRIDYDEYGRVTQNTNPGFQPFGYVGGLLDSHTGLTRFGARDYDAATGRWTAKEPLGFSSGTENLYSYVSGNPTNLSDPTGLCEVDPDQDCGPVPKGPPGASVDANMAEVATHVDPRWFKRQVTNYGPWDYKREGIGNQYEAFGNFNYGATGFVFGFTETMLLREAGRQQVLDGRSRPEWGYPGDSHFWGGKPPYGDQPEDQVQIRQGIEYAKCRIRKGLY
jgi:RHS repeat-associated protein